MRERVAFAGGSLAVKSSADGTQLVFTLPATRRRRAAEPVSAPVDVPDDV